MTHGNASTFPFVAREICWIEPDQVLAAAEGANHNFSATTATARTANAPASSIWSMTGVSRNSAASMPPTYHSLHKVRGTLRSPASIAPGLAPARATRKLFLGIKRRKRPRQGRGRHAPSRRPPSHCRKFRPNLSITPQQDLLLRDLDPSTRPEIDRILVEFGIVREDKISLVQQYSMACPAIPTCGLALSEAERTLPQIIDELESAHREPGLSDEKISVRMTGCPTRLRIRPYPERHRHRRSIRTTSSNGLRRRQPFRRTAEFPAARSGAPKRNLSAPGPLAAASYRGERRNAEGFGDFCHRLGQAEVQRRGRGAGCGDMGINRGRNRAA